MAFEASLSVDVQSLCCSLSHGVLSLHCFTVPTAHSPHYASGSHNWSPPLQWHNLSLFSSFIFSFPIPLSRSHLSFSELFTFTHTIILSLISLLLFSPSLSPTHTHTYRQMKCICGTYAGYSLQEMLFNFILEMPMINLSNWLNRIRISRSSILNAPSSGNGGRT